MANNPDVQNIRRFFNTLQGNYDDAAAGKEIVSASD
jgi:hypothetical protein